jgi:hypothetical protein
MTTLAWSAGPVRPSPPCFMSKMSSHTRRKPPLAQSLLIWIGHTTLSMKYPTWCLFSRNLALLTMSNLKCICIPADLPETPANPIVKNPSEASSTAHGSRKVKRFVCRVLSARSASRSSMTHEILISLAPVHASQWMLSLLAE